MGLAALSADFASTATTRCALNLRTLMLLLLLPLLALPAAALHSPWPTESCPPALGPCRERNNGTRSCVTCKDGLCEINVAIVLPADPQYIVNNNATLIALVESEVAANESGLLPDYIHFNYIQMDDNCDAEGSIMGMMDAYTLYCAHVIIGPVCDFALAPVGRYTKNLGQHGTPLMTPGGFVFDLTENKTTCDNEYYMVLNTGSVDYRSLSEFAVRFMNKWNWRKVALLYDRNELVEVGGERSCQLLFSSVIEELKTTDKFEYQDGDIQLLNITIKEYLEKEVGVKFGVIFVCGSHYTSRRVAIEAQKLGMMDNGEYTFLNFVLYNNAPKPWNPWVDSEPALDERGNNLARSAYKNFYTLAPWLEAEIMQERQEEVRGISLINGVYDAMTMYIHALKKVIKLEHGKPKDNQTLKGYEIIDNIIGQTFPGKGGRNFTMNCNGQRVSSFALLQTNEDSTGMEIVAEYNMLTKNISFRRDMHWKTQPLDTPTCGYNNIKCGVDDMKIILITTFSVSFVLCFFIVAVIYWRRYVNEKELMSMSWKIFPSSLDMRSPGSIDNVSILGEKQLFTELARYKGNIVSIKKLKCPKFELTREHLSQLKFIRDLTHNHIVKFYGACLEPDGIRIVTEYCPKGSLLDVLQDEKIKLDYMFKISLINDLVRALHYLHNTELKKHGNLKSANCVLDNRLTLKITDFGLTFWKSYPKHTHVREINFEEYKWTAPEILRNIILDEYVKRDNSGTPAGDVYAFGIIVHEIMIQKGPFYIGYYLDPKEIVENVKNGPESKQAPFRPLIESCDDQISAMMTMCWAEEAADRPDFNQLKDTVKKLNKEYDSGNILDNLLSRMEQYANNLETLVEERTADYLEEKRRCEEVLYQLLPKSVAQQLIMGNSVIAETFQQVTIYFSDIVGFTSLSAKSTPMQIVSFLNDLYTCFDEVIGHFDVYKVETIGDAYMVVSGLPEPNGTQHAAEIARMSLRLLAEVRQFKISHMPNIPLKLRIGLHTGQVAAGVVGQKMPRYCLFGDTVNTASRMESNGEPLRIHVSADTKAVLDTFNCFDLECRGQIEVKGKSPMVTYWLNGEHKPAAAPKKEQSPPVDTKPAPHLMAHVDQPDWPYSNRAKEPCVPNDGKEETVPLLSITSPHHS